MTSQSQDSKKKTFELVEKQMSPEHLPLQLIDHSNKLFIDHNSISHWELTALASAQPLCGDHILPSPIKPRAR